MDTRLFYNAPNDKIHLVVDIEEDTIIGIGFCSKQRSSVPETELEKEIFNQLDMYFTGKLREFDLPFFSTGTVFQLMVWEALMQIPYGETISYGELANRIGKPKAYRAVGGALNRNPVPILVPCHRVVGISGKLTGFAGGLPSKDYLIKLEKAHCK